MMELVWTIAWGIVVGYTLIGAISVGLTVLIALVGYVLIRLDVI